MFGRPVTTPKTSNRFKIPTMTIAFVSISSDQLASLDVAPLEALSSFPELFFAGGLAEGFNSVSLVVEGYDADPRELCEIPEVRAYFVHLLERWPYWFFFCSLEDSNLMMMLLSVVPELIVCRRSGLVNFQISGPGLSPLLLRLFAHMNPLCEICGFSESMIMTRTDDVVDYIGEIVRKSL